jgi:hypothetical protein
MSEAVVAAPERERPEAPATGRLRVLLLCNYAPTDAPTVCDHINAFFTYSAHDVFTVSNLGDLPDKIDLQRFDVVIVHYSLTLCIDAYVSARTKHRLRAFRGLKVLFIQDEYRFVSQTIDAIRDVGITLVCSVIPESELRRVYPAEALPGVRFESVLTGCVPHWLTVYKPLPLDKRRVDVGYRGRRYPAWLGELGLEKWQIADRFLEDARRFGLRCDISHKEQKRLYGRAWVDFIRNCRAVLGVESGASVLDVDGGIAARTDTYAALIHEPSYETLRELYFADHERGVTQNQISPRAFEAVALRTLMILYEGHYSGVLTPWRHYLPLKKDHSNMEEIVKVLRDDHAVAQIIANAFAEVALNPRYSYKQFMARIDALLDEEMTPAMRGAPHGYTVEELQAIRPFFRVDNPYGLDVSRGGIRAPLARLARAARRRLARWLR